MNQVQHFVKYRATYLQPPTTQPMLQLFVVVLIWEVWEADKKLTHLVSSPTVSKWCLLPKTPKSLSLLPSTQIRRPLCQHMAESNNEFQQGTKFDNIFFEGSRALEAPELNLLMNQREQETIQVFTILMLSLENPWIAGYRPLGTAICC